MNDLEEMEIEELLPDEEEASVSYEEEKDSEPFQGSSRRKDFKDLPDEEETNEDVRPAKKSGKAVKRVLFFFLLCAVICVAVWAGITYQKAVQTDAPVPEPSEKTYTKGEVDLMVSDALLKQEQQLTARLEAEYASKEDPLAQIKEELLNGTTVVETLRPLYKDELVVVSGGKFNFVPIDPNIPKHDYKQENVVKEDGIVTYVVDGQVVSHKGIDVSKHQGKIDWEQVAQDGVEFAIIRVGLRGYGTGKLADDEFFEDNIKGAASHGIRVGVYFFAQAITVEEALEEADYVLEKIAPYKLQCPVVYDVERVGSNDARMNALNAQERTDITVAFCEKIKAAGYKPMIYHNLEAAALMLEMDRLVDYEKWYAYYGTTIYYPYEYGVWQYSDTGKVKGIKTDVDLNIAFHLWDE